MAAPQVNSAMKKFIKKHKLKIKIGEVDNNLRSIGVYHAYIDGTETVRDIFLEGTGGRGDSPLSAVLDLMGKISGLRLRKMRSGKEIQVPDFLGCKPTKNKFSAL